RGSLNSGRANLSAVASAGRAWAFGGAGDGGHSLSSVEVIRYTSILTDRIDYPPNSVVTFTGSGFIPGESVSLLVRRSTDQDPGTTLSTVADGFGRIENHEFSTTSNDSGVVFSVTATGADSKLPALNKFHDSLYVTSLGVGAMLQTTSTLDLAIYGG